MLAKCNHLPLSLSPSNPSRFLCYSLLKSIASFSLIIVVHTRGWWGEEGKEGGMEGGREGGREIDLEH